MKRGMVCLTIVLGATCLFSGKAFGWGAETPIESDRVASGLARPVFVTYAPGDYNRLYIVEKQGRIRVLNLVTGLLNAGFFLDIDALVGGGTSDDNEQGLLGFAFHPNYPATNLFYVNYTNTAGDTTIASYSLTSADQANAGSANIMLVIDQPQANHNGGWIGFSPNDGYLYIAMGDGGNACDEGTGHTAGTGNAQDLTLNLLGKMLRIDVDTDDFPADPNKDYGIPPTNPYVGISGDDEIWANGLRNPYRCSFDRLNGDLYIGDVGQGAQEEVDYQSGSSPGGENYGWRCMEGTGCSSASGCPTTGCTCGSALLTDPIHAYTHSPPPPPAGFVCSVIGGNVYRGCAIETLQGTYFLADYCGDAIWSFRQVGGAVTEFMNRTPRLSPSVDGFTITDVVAFGEDAAGEIYIVDQGPGAAAGQIFKIIPEGGPLVDCQPNGVEDACDILDGTSSDANLNEIPDECETAMASVTAARSCIPHNGTEFCAEINVGLPGPAGNTEPRQPGVSEIEVDFDEVITSLEATIDCHDGTTFRNVFEEILGGGMQARITWPGGGPLPNLKCCTITLSGDSTSTFDIRPLPGDVDQNGSVNGADITAIKPHLGELVKESNFLTDFDVNGFINGADITAVKPILGTTAAACP